MLKREKTSIITFYAISPIHAGAGSSTSVVDLPIQRERHTNWPHIQASSVKGAMRQHFRRFAENALEGKEKKAKDYINYIFGNDDVNDTSNPVMMKNNSEKDEKVPIAAGIISVSDAKIFAFPMRSSIAPFVHITCPAVLKRLENDLKFCALENLKFECTVPPVTEDNAFILKGDQNFNGKILLEDMVVNLQQNNQEGNKSIVQSLGDLLKDIETLILVSDEVFNYCVSYCTEIQTQIKINTQTGTTLDGSLRYQELLPADTLLYSVVYFSASAFDNALQAETVQKTVQSSISDFMQIGGDETMGRGICKIAWY